jgi:hypothetical protein
VGTHPTTIEEIRNRAIAVVEALTPTRLAGDRFVASRNEGAAAFVAWCEANPAGCRRRFQIRDVGEALPAEITNTTIDPQEVTFEVRVAYPQTGRDGPQQGLDRDDTIDEDERLLESALGLYGAANFTYPLPDACWLSADVERVTGTAVDFLVITQRMLYLREMRAVPLLATIVGTLEQSIGTFTLLAEGEVSSTWTVDATSGIGTPLTEAEAEAVLSASAVAAPNVTSLWRFGSPASGNVPDVVGARTLTASGTWAYQQAVTGWAIQSMRSTAGTAARALNTTFGNVNANSYVVFLLAAHLSSITSTRTLWRFGNTFDDDACVEYTSSGSNRIQVGEGDGTRTSGTNDPTGAARWHVLRIDDTANTVDLFDDQEKIVGGSQACNGTELCFGGDNNQTWFPGSTDYMLAFVHAGTMTNAEIKAALTQLGHSPAWTP